MRPILFLDVDGVLNRSAKAYGRMQPELVLRLANVCTETHCAIVVSSDWRLGGIERGSDFERAITAQPGGLTVYAQVIGRTGSSKLGRAVEILSWLEVNHRAKSFAVVDDIDMTEHFGESMVLCKSSSGLTEERAARLIELLE